MSKNKKISIIGTVGLPANYGGFETLVENLVSNLGDEISFNVYCSSKNYTNKVKKYKEARLIYIPINANGKSSIIYDAVSIFHSLFHSKILIILGVSGAFMFPFVKLFTSKVIITNIDGLEWKRDKWGKLASRYLKWQEKIAIKYSNKIVADNIGIQEYISQRYGKNSHLIAYGGDHAEKVPLTIELKEKYKLSETYTFSVCRIEPENNLHTILQAFTSLEEQLVIIGNWAASQYGINLKSEYSKFENIRMIDPIYDPDKLNSIRGNCKLYLHGHSAGGTNPSLVEAMWLELPIFCFDVDYNKYTTDHKAKYFNSSEQLKELILQTSDEELTQISNELKKIAIKNYKWKHIAQEYKLLFGRL